MTSKLGYRSLFYQESLSTKSIGRKCFSWHVKNKEAKGLFGFFFLSSLITLHSIFATHHSSLKIPQFPQPHPFGTHHSILLLLFVSKKSWNVKICGWALFPKKKKNPKVKHCSWIVRVVSLITEMSLKTKLWKIKTPEMWFSFP